MDKADLIKNCRYYRGEEHCPSEAIGLFWDYERLWVEWVLEAQENENCDAAKRLDNMTREYLKAGYKDFSLSDGVPVSLKAILFNRFEHWNQSDGFQEWYMEQYLWRGSELAHNLLAACHYYGRDFDHSDPNKEMLAFYEEWWVRRKLECPNDEERNALFANYIDEYLMAGLREFQMADGVPITLKAVLFNRYAKSDYSLESAAAGFMEFYLKYYSDEALR